MIVFEYNQERCLEEVVKQNPQFAPELYKTKDQIREGKEEERMQHTNELLYQYYSSHSPNAPKCPTCQSTNIRKIGGLERTASVSVFGLFSRKINKTFECRNCGLTW